MVWLPDCVKTLMICLAVSTEYRRVTDRQTDKRTGGQTSCHGIVRAMHTRRAVKNQFQQTNVILHRACPSRRVHFHANGALTSTLNTPWVKVNPYAEFVPYRHSRLAAYKEHTHTRTHNGKYIQ